MFEISPSRQAALNDLIVHILRKSISQMHFIGISGPPGAGKTTLSKELERILIGRGLNVIIISQDDFRIDKDQRIDEQGNFLVDDLPFINQWHHWRDIYNVLQFIKNTQAESGSFKMKLYDSKTHKRTKLHEYKTKRDLPYIIIIEGAFIYNIGTNNIYGLRADSIVSILNEQIFVYQKSPDYFDMNNFENVLVLRKLKYPDNIGKEIILRQQVKHCSKHLEKCIKTTKSSWKKANIHFDNNDFNNPILTLVDKKNTSISGVSNG
jgi:uridine kinase